jgi:hypothetical protein
MQLFTVARFQTSAEAHVAKNALEAEGIRAMVADELMGWGRSGMAVHGGVKVQVREEDAERAAAVLRDAGGQSEVDPSAGS